MAPSPRDRLLAEQAFSHPWFTSDEEYGSKPIVVENKMSTECMVHSVESKIQSTLASATWTQGTVSSSERASDPNKGGLREYEYEDEKLIIRMGTSGTISDVRATAKGNIEELRGSVDDGLSFETTDENLAFSGHRDAGLDKEVHTSFEEPSSTVSDNSGPDEDTPSRCTYMEDADEDGNPIEGTIVSTGPAHQQHFSTTETRARDVSAKPNRSQRYSRSRSPSPLGQRQRISELTVQDRGVHTGDGRPSSPGHSKATEQFAGSQDYGRAARPYSMSSHRNGESYEKHKRQRRRLILWSRPTRI